ncbi:hypothetical protein HY501_03660 [Candidatus Woesearchaeota archaeon]|nr:hypothetical protein [Candidatus Woesearchaeota archaeon]
MKKGQLTGDIFIYIFAVIVGALILVYGVKTIIDLKSTAETVDLGRTLKNLEAEIETFYNYGEGSTKDIQLSLPKPVKFVCFTDPTSSPKPSKCKVKTGADTYGNCNLGALDEEFALIVEDENTKNVFFLPLATAKISRYEIKDLKPKEGNPLCIANGLSLTITAKVTHVEVS